MSFAFHVSRKARDRYGIDDELVTLTGNVVLPDAASNRRLAQRMNQAPERAGSPDRTVNAGQLMAMGLVDEILHRVVAMYREQVRPTVMRDAIEALTRRLGPEQLDATLAAFVDSFPTAEARRTAQAPADYLAGTTAGMPNREIALEELLLLWLANANPAYAPFRELFDDSPLRRTPYGEVIGGMAAFFAAQPPFGPQHQSLIEMLRAPAVAVPNSLAGQLRFLRERWGLVVAEYGDRFLVSLDILAEEERAVWARFHPDAGGGPEDAAARAGAAWLAESGWLSPAEGEPEAEAFSPDTDWMPRLVLIAKNTYVWLDQLSRRYGRPIGRSTRSPTRSSTASRARGFTGLWLIGLWERSAASRDDQAAAWQSRGGRLGLLALRLPDRRRPRRRGSATRTCATGPGSAASAWPATWCPTTWASTRAG